MSIYRGVSGVNRDVARVLRGASGVNREIGEIYRGVSGVSRLVFSSQSYLVSVSANGGFAVGSDGSVSYSVSLTASGGSVSKDLVFSVTDRSGNAVTFSGAAGDEVFRLEKPRFYVTGGSSVTGLLSVIAGGTASWSGSYSAKTTDGRWTSDMVCTASAAQVNRTVGSFTLRINCSGTASARTVYFNSYPEGLFLLGEKILRVNT